MAEISRRSIVYDILFNVEQGKVSAKQAEQQLGKLDKTAQKVTTSFKSLGVAMFGAFGAQELTRQVAQFTKEAAQLGLKAEGVRRAFVALNNPNLLADLRKATRGTVDDLTLMQTAVRADKFKIPLNELARLLKFAQVRARETGQSVDFLTNSIVDGIGKKSALILDNLGLSAVQIQEEFKKTGDFATAVGNIIETELGKAGEAGDTAADKFERFNTSITNLKLAFGELLIKATPAIEVLTQQIQSFTDASTLSKLAQMQLSIFGLGGAFSGLRNLIKGASDEMDSFEPPRWFSELAKTANAANKPTEILGTTIVDLNQKIDELRLLQQGLNIDTDSGIETFRDYEQEIRKIEDRIKSLTEVTKTWKRETDSIIETLNFLASGAIAQDEVGLQNLSGTIQQTIKDTGSINLALEKRAEAAQVFTDTISNGFATLSQLAKDGSTQQLALALASILASQAQALASAIAAASQAGIFTGAAAPFAIPAFIATLTGVILGSFAGVFSTIKQAQAAQANAFAEGVIDLHRPGETKGKDSIPATLMPGESVMTTKETVKHKGILKAIRANSFDEFIQRNYIDPALAVAGLEYAIKDSRQMPDYSERLYRQLLEEKENNIWNKKIFSVLKEKRNPRWRH